MLAKGKGGALKGLLSGLVAGECGYGVEVFPCVAEEALVHFDLPVVIELRIVECEELKGLVHLPHCPIRRALISAAQLRSRCREY